MGQRCPFTKQPVTSNILTLLSVVPAYSLASLTWEFVCSCNCDSEQSPHPVAVMSCCTNSLHTSHYKYSAAHLTLHTSHCTLHTGCFTLHTLCRTLHTTHLTLHTSCCTLNTEYSALRRTAQCTVQQCKVHPKYALNGVKLHTTQEEASPFPRECL